MLAIRAQSSKAFAKPVKTIQQRPEQLPTFFLGVPHYSYTLNPKPYTKPPVQLLRLLVLSLPTGFEVTGRFGVRRLARLEEGSESTSFNYNQEYQQASRD